MLGFYGQGDSPLVFLPAYLLVFFSSVQHLLDLYRPSCLVCRWSVSLLELFELMQGSAGKLLIQNTVYKYSILSSETYLRLPTPTYAYLRLPTPTYAYLRLPMSAHA
jgi:hypothetical protein